LAALWLHTAASCGDKNQGAFSCWEYTYPTLPFVAYTRTTLGPVDRDQARVRRILVDSEQSG
jgi:hypothetical protein